jgi:soluble lytic murein transglycosylase-like protein
MASVSSLARSRARDAAARRARSAALALALARLVLVCGDLVVVVFAAVDLAVVVDLAGAAGFLVAVVWADNCPPANTVNATTAASEDRTNLKCIDPYFPSAARKMCGIVTPQVLKRQWVPAF